MGESEQQDDVDELWRFWAEVAEQFLLRRAGFERPWQRGHGGRWVVRAPKRQYVAGRAALGDEELGPETRWQLRVARLVSKLNEMLRTSDPQGYRYGNNWRNMKEGFEKLESRHGTKKLGHLCSGEAPREGQLKELRKRLEAARRRDREERRKWRIEC